MAKQSSNLGTNASGVALIQDAHYKTHYNADTYSLVDVIRDEALLTHHRTNQKHWLCIDDLVKADKPKEIKRYLR